VALSNEYYTINNMHPVLLRAGDFLEKVLGLLRHRASSRVMVEGAPVLSGDGRRTVEGGHGRPQ
jgi:hypothetical protein